MPFIELGGFSLLLAGQDHFRAVGAYLQGMPVSVALAKRKAEDCALIRCFTLSVPRPSNAFAGKMNITPCFLADWVQGLIGQPLRLRWAEFFLFLQRWIRQSSLGCRVARACGALVSYFFSWLSLLMDRLVLRWGAARFHWARRIQGNIPPSW